MRRAASATFTPFAARARAMEAPMPELAPVTMAVRPFRSIMRHPQAAVRMTVRNRNAVPMFRLVQAAQEHQHGQIRFPDRW